MKEEKSVTKAKELIKSPAAKGNHGFTGKQLVAWNKQRTFWMARLKEVAAGKKPRASWGPDCPRYAVEQTIVKIDKAVKRTCNVCRTGVGCNSAQGKRVRNPAWSNGTAEGARWVAAAEKLVNKVYYDQA